MTQATVVSVEKVWLSNHEAQKYLGMGMDFFKQLRANGNLPYVKVGKSVFYKKKDIDRLLERHRVY